MKQGTKNQPSNLNHHSYLRCMKVAVYSREGAVLAPQDLTQLCDALKAAGIEAVVYAQLPLENFKTQKTFLHENELDASFDAVISLGGDGTLLDTLCLVRDKQIPVLGINYGRLGFLASLRKEDLQEAVDALKTIHMYWIKEVWCTSMQVFRYLEEILLH